MSRPIKQGEYQPLLRPILIQQILLVQKSQAGCTQTDVEAFLSDLHMNFDLTLIDRLQLLLYRLPSSSPNGKPSTLQPVSERVKHSLYMTSSNMQTIHQVSRQHSH